MRPLQNKAIVITGAGRGIGAACARIAAELGARVVVNDRDAAPAEATVRTIREAGGEATACVSDIVSWQGAEALIEHCVKTFGTIDGLVNNAGLFAMSRLDELSPEHLNALFEVNVKGSANCAHHAAKHMAARKSGAIVNIVSGAQMGIPTMGVYGATKAAMASFTYTWALELAPLGIRVNAISPMAISRMGETTKKYLQEHGLPQYPEQTQTPEMNAGAICYLLSDQARDVNGQVVRIEGRQLALTSHPMIVTPILERDFWTFEAVAEAFATDLGKRQMPIGIASAKVIPEGRGSAMWSKNT